LVTGTSGEYAERLITTSQGTARTDSRAVGAEVAVRYTTDIGTQLEAGAAGDVSWRSANVTPASNNTVSLGPAPAASVHVSAIQPLLRGGGRDINLAALREARAHRSEAHRARDEAASGLVRDVLLAYWELWYAQRAMAVQEAALQAALAQQRDAEARFQLGTAARTEVLRFASQAASIRESVAAARISSQARALELGRLLASDGAASSTATDVEPPPTRTPPPLADLLQAARESCNELRAMAASVQASHERAGAAADGDQPRLDLTTTVSASGLWMDDTLPGLTLPGDRPAWTAMLGLELELPLVRSAAAAEHARALAQVTAASARYQARVQAIDAQVAELHARLAAAAERVALARTMAEAAKELAEAERHRLQLGTATSTDVVQAQQNEREAELQHLRVRVDQVQAALQLDHLIGALLVRHADALARVER
jgi:outer membrane protein TolC